MQNKIDDVVLSKVTKIHKTFFEVLTSCGHKGIVYISDISDYYVKDINEIVQPNSILYLIVKEKKSDHFILSFKKNRSEFLRTPFEFRIEHKETNFKNLFDFTRKEINKWKK